MNVIQNSNNIVLYGAGNNKILIAQSIIARFTSSGIPSWVRQRKLKLALITTAITGAVCYGLYSNGAVMQAAFARDALNDFCDKCTSARLFFLGGGGGV